MLSTNKPTLESVPGSVLHQNKTQALLGSERALGNGGYAAVCSAAPLLLRGWLCLQVGYMHPRHCSPALLPCPQLKPVPSA